MHYFAAPLIFVMIVAYFIAHCIFSVYEMVIDTLFLCFCEDYNKNDGSPGREYYAPPSLMVSSCVNGALQLPSCTIYRRT